MREQHRDDHALPIREEDDGLDAQELVAGKRGGALMMMRRRRVRMRRGLMRRGLTRRRRSLVKMCALGAG